MNKLMVLALSMALIGSAIMADLASAFGINITRKSIDCDEVLTGVSRPELNDSNVVCAVSITEIFRGPCINPGGNADPANGQPYQVPPGSGEIIGVNLGTALPLSRTGKSFSEIIFSDAEIATFLGDLVNPDVVCPNGNWIVPFAVTKLDAMGEVLSGAIAQGGQCSINPNSFDFGSCVVTAGASACHQDECLRVSPCVAPQNLTKNVPFACTCVEHLIDGVPQNKCIYGIK
jgi:hypothetical protein